MRRIANFPGATVAYSKEFIGETKRVWQPYAPYPLTDEDAREIADNMTALMLLLTDLDGKYRQHKNPAKLAKSA